MDWTGNKNSIFKTLGASNHTSQQREENDYYATEPKAIDVLLAAGATLNYNVWECACGAGHLAERLKKYGFNVYATDLIYRGYGDGVIDFLKCNTKWNGDILTNPPYKYARQFIEHAMSLISDGQRVYMFLKVQFLEGKKRRKLFEEYPPRHVYVSSGRLLCAKNAMFDELKTRGKSAVAYAWFEFEKGYHGASVIKWIN